MGRCIFHELHSSILSLMAIDLTFHFTEQKRGIYIHLNFKSPRDSSVHHALVTIKARLDYEGHINVFPS